MATVVSRTFRSTPHRTGLETWVAIVDLLTTGQGKDGRDELTAVGGIAASLITDRCPKSSPIVVVCEGPRTRIYCTYDEDAIDGTDENEDALGFNPLNGEWAISLPCSADDLDWVSASLKKHSSRITARDQDSGVEEGGNTSRKGLNLTLDPEGFLKP